MTKVRTKNLAIVVVLAVAVLLAGGGVLWWAQRSTEIPAPVSTDAISDGEELAAELAGGDAAVAERQTVSSAELFQYGFDEDDLAEGADGHPFIADQLVVTTADGAGLEQAEAAAATIDARVVGVNAVLRRYQLLLGEKVSQDELAELGERVAASPGVEAVKENGVAATSSDAVVPADGGSKLDDAGDWGMQALGAAVVWDGADAIEPVTVGVLDEFYLGRWHKDLPQVSPRYVPPRVPGAGATWHGVRVAGTIAARSDRPTGMRGVAPNADLAVAGSFQVGTPVGWLEQQVLRVVFKDDFSLDSALTHLVDESGAKVVNMSFGAGDGRAAQEGDNEARAWLAKWGTQRARTLNTLLEDHDFLVVDAAGNSSCTQEQVDTGERGCTVVGALDAGIELKGAARGTALADRLLTVGATAPSEDAAGFEVAWYSNSNADVVAPGTDVRSTGADDGYELGTGTSMAAPSVSGLATALLGTDPELTAAEARTIIVGTAGTAPSARWNDQDDPTTSAPIVNGAAAFQAASQVAGLDGQERADFVAQVGEGAVTVAGSRLSPQLLGTWCLPADGEPTDCFSLQDHLVAEDRRGLAPREKDSGDPNLTPDDATARRTTASTLALCDEGACGASDPVVTLRYFPPGAVSDPGSPDAVHDVSYPRLAEVNRDTDALVPGKTFRLTTGVEGAHPDLPFEPAEPPTLSPDTMDGRWVPADGSGAGFTIRDTVVTFDSGEVLEVFQPDPTGEGMDVGTIAPGYRSCMEPGSGCAPLGRLVPAGTSAGIDESYGVDDVPDRDRIWNSQTGELFVRE